MDWIHIKDKQPEFGEVVNILKDKPETRARFSRLSISFDGTGKHTLFRGVFIIENENGFYPYIEAEYWQPLPEPPKKQGPFSSRLCVNGDQVLLFEGSNVMYLTISKECIKDLCAWLNRKWNSK